MNYFSYKSLQAAITQLVGDGSKYNSFCTIQGNFDNPKKIQNFAREAFQEIWQKDILVHVKLSTRMEGRQQLHTIKIRPEIISQDPDYSLAKEERYKKLRKGVSAITKQFQHTLEKKKNCGIYPTEDEIVLETLDHIKDLPLNKPLKKGFLRFSLVNKYIARKKIHDPYKLHKPLPRMAVFYAGFYPKNHKPTVNPELCRKYLEDNGTDRLDRKKFTKHIVENDPYFKDEENCCIISKEYPKDPVRIQGENALYERSNLKRWLQSHQDQSPFSRRTVTPSKIKSDREFDRFEKQIINSYLMELERQRKIILAA